MSQKHGFGDHRPDIERLIADEPFRTATNRVEIQLIENYKRIHYFAKRTAKIVGSFESANDREALAAADAAL